MSPDELTIGFIGLGAMGWHMAANLAGRFPRVLVHNRTSATARRHARQHGTTAVALDGFSSVDVLVTCLPTTAVVAEVAADLAPTLRAGTTWVDCTSGDPDSSRVLAATLAERGIRMLDAPVSGGTNGAQAATLTTMVGGEEAVLAEVRSVLEAMAGRVVHVGPFGAGHAVKAVNNTLLAANLVTAVEGLLALRALGIDPGAAIEVLNHASGRSFATEHPVPERIVARTFENTFTLGLLAKDVGIGMAVLDAAGDAAPVLRAVAATFAEARDAVGPHGDHTEIAKHLEQQAGRTLG